MRLARRHLVLACALLAGGLLALPARAAADTATAGVPTGGTAAPGGGTAAPGGGTTTPRSSSSAGLVLRAGRHGSGDRWRALGQQRLVGPDRRHRRLARVHRCGHRPYRRDGRAPGGVS